MKVVKRITDPVSAEHWSGGDTILREQMEAGTHCYWTVVDVLPPSHHCPEGRTVAALEGRRYPSYVSAEQALARHLVLEREDESRRGVHGREAMDWQLHLDAAATGASMSRAKEQFSRLLTALDESQEVFERLEDDARLAVLRIFAECLFPTPADAIPALERLLGACRQRPCEQCGDPVVRAEGARGSIVCEACASKGGPS